MVLIIVPMIGSVAYAAEKEVITSIKGTSNIPDVLVLGDKLENPTIEITSGSPAKFNDRGIMNWYRKVNGNWVRCQKHQSVVPGEYCIKFANFGVYGNDYNNYTLCADTSLTIDDEVWETNNDYEAETTYCVISAKSPIYTVENDSSKKIISSMELEYSKVYYDGNPKTPTVTVKDQSGTELEKDVDYTVTYTGNVNVTTSALVVVNGINENGVYGTWGKYFEIKQVPISPENQTKISVIEGTTNISELIKYGSPVLNPTIEITTGKPAKYNTAGNMNWMKKKANGNWAACKWEDTFKEGEYRLICYFGVYNDNFYDYVLDDSAVVKLDGVTWEIESEPYVESNSYSAMRVLSPVFTVTIPIESVKLSTSTYTYDGYVKSPDLIIKDVNGKTLVNGTDYIVTVPNGRKNIGTYTYNVTFVNNYSGTTSVSFVINQASIADKTASLAYTETVYTGSEKKPAVTIAGLVENQDYTVSYSGNKKVGKATVTINGKGNYTGTFTKAFTIKPAKAAIKSMTSGTKKLTVKISGKPSAKGASTYQIYYKQKGTSTWKKTTTTSNSKTIKKLKKGKQYYVKVRAYKKVGNTTYYGDFSRTKLSKKIK